MSYHHSHPPFDPVCPAKLPDESHETDEGWVTDVDADSVSVVSKDSFENVTDGDTDYQQMIEQFEAFTLHSEPPSDDVGKNADVGSVQPTDPEAETDFAWYFSSTSEDELAERLEDALFPGYAARKDQEDHSKWLKNRQ